MSAISPHDDSPPSIPNRVARLLVSTGPIASDAWWAHSLVLLSRIYAGVTIAFAGLSKLPTPDWMRDQVAQVGFPVPAFFAFVASLTELAGGFLLVVGLFARPATLLLAITMAVAAFGYHKLTPFLEMHIAQGFFWLFVLLLATGPGRLSIDELLARSLTPRRSTPPQLHGPTQHRALVRWLAAIVLTAAPVVYGTYRELALPPVPPASTNLSIDRLNVAGSFNQWSITATPMQRPSDSSVWATEVYFDTPGNVTFKFAANGTWDLNLGAAPDAQPLVMQADTPGVPNGANIVLSVPTPGRYRIELDSSRLTYRATHLPD